MTVAIVSEPLEAQAISGHWLVRAVRVIVSIIVAQGLLGAVLLLGYLYRRMQRHVLHVWSDGSQPFSSPKWFAGEISAATTTLPRRAVAALLDNLRIGINATAALAALVTPAMLLLAISWHAGWNNSFNKGYEDASIGPLLGVGGIALAMFTLCYLPFAQARHAATGDWRCLFDWRANITLAGCRNRELFVLPVAALGLSVVMLASRGVLTFAPQMPAFAELTDDPTTFMNRWFFCWGALFIAVLYLCKRTMARGYARTIAQALRCGHVDISHLHPEEQRLLTRFGHRNAHSIEPPGLTVSLVRILLPLPLWFPVLGLLYVQQFLNNVGVWGWFNLPFAWLPLLSYQP